MLNLVEQVVHYEDKKKEEYEEIQEELQEDNISNKSQGSFEPESMASVFI